VRHLDREQPVYGLQMQYPEENELGRPYTLEERRGWAAHYLELMRGVQPEGPYLIVGMCEGALIAFEMVRRLEAEGQRVALLGTLDTWPEENTSHQLLHRVFLYQRRLRDVWRSPRPQQIAFVKSRTEKALRILADAFRAPEERRIPPRPKMSPWDVRMFPGPSFVPPTVSCRIDVFRTRSQPYWRLEDPELGWGSRTTGGVDVHYILGDHDTFMREQHIGPLAEQLGECLRNAEEEIARLSLSRARADVAAKLSLDAGDGAG
jgi:thioesterase domain-containing protein